MSVFPAGSSPEPRYLWGTRLFLRWFTFSLAAHTLLTHAFQVRGWPFRSLAWCSAAAVLATTAWVACAALRRSKCSRSGIDRWACALAVGLAALCALMGSTSSRPDTDDYYYVPAAVHALEHPDEPMGFQVRGLIPPPGEELVSYNFSTSLPFEYASAVAAWWTGFDYLTIYYVWMPALVSALIAVAYLHLAGQLGLDPLATVLGVAVGVAFLLSMGETHWCYGNFAFARAFHGKTLLLAAGIASFGAGTIEFLRTPRLTSWIALGATATALLGCTSSTIVLLPMLSLVLGLATLAVRGLSLRSLGLVCIQGLSLAYVLAYAAVYLATGTAEGLGVDSAVNAGFPRTYAGHVGLMVDVSAPVWPFVALIAALVYFRWARREERVFAGVWIAACLALFLNPLAASFLIEHATSPNIYWRLFYLLPVPAFVAAAAALALDRVSARRGRQLAAASGLVLVSLVLQLALPRTSVLRQAGIGAPRFKLPPDHLADARAIVDLPAPPGGMMAPPHVAGIVPMLTSSHPQILRRGEAECLWLDGGRLGARTVQRLRATQFVEQGGQGMQAFLECATELAPASILLTPKAWQDLANQGHVGALSDLGYGEPQRVGRFLLLAKSPPQPAPPVR